MVLCILEKVTNKNTHFKQELHWTVILMVSAWKEKLHQVNPASSDMLSLKYGAQSTMDQMSSTDKQHSMSLTH